MGVSIVLYQMAPAASIQTLSAAAVQIDPSKSINLYKMTEDLGIIFMDTEDPYNDTEALPYQMLFGEFVTEQIGDRVINGFVSSTLVRSIYHWIMEKQITTLAGFSNMYDSLSPEARQALESIGAEGKEELFEGYVKPLTQFYLAAANEGNSIVVCGE
jgi:hypothetical protein